MIVVLRTNTTTEEKHAIVELIRRTGFDVKVTEGASHTVLGITGDTKKMELHEMMIHPQVEKVLKITVPYKMASRDFSPADTQIHVGNTTIGNGSMTVIAGPCSIESRDQINTIARSVKASGAHILRGGAFKPRTSPYSFQGMGELGLKLLKEAGEANGMPVCTEVMCTEEFDLVEAYTDILQIGARNMQNFSLLKKAGRSPKPVLLKRGMSATIEDLLMSAEYILASGNPNVILCERGIRTFEPYTRNTLDLSVVSAIRTLSHLPIIIDPSHATGRWEMVSPMSKAAVAIGADGLMIEVHHDPEHALSDGPQSLKPERFSLLMGQLGEIHRLCSSQTLNEMVGKCHVAI
jgi:3-deoxy-7-phosphoheptulonate synthase